jgi:hypothetical protein
MLQCMRLVLAFQFQRRMFEIIVIHIFEILLSCIKYRTDGYQNTEPLFVSAVNRIPVLDSAYAPI